MRVRSLVSRSASLRLLVATTVIFALGSGTAIAAGKWEVGSSAGALVRSKAGTAYTQLSIGTYVATFNSDQSKCAYIATPGDPGSGAVSGPVIATVATRSGNNNALFLQTWDQSTGALTNAPVHVATYCGTKKTYAVVGANGALARGSRVVSTARVGAGAYEVIFDRKVNTCAFTASIGTTGTGSVVAPGLITVAGRAGNKFGVFVNTVDRSGIQTDMPFHLAANCGGDYAVVESNGTLARGAHVVSVTKLSGTNGGTYEVIFDRTVSACAYTATIGLSTNGGSINTPVAVTTATRAGNANGVFVFIHQTNGSTIDEPFHLNVSC